MRMSFNPVHAPSSPHLTSLKPKLTLHSPHDKAPLLLPDKLIDIVCPLLAITAQLLHAVSRKSQLLRPFSQIP
jgi:hypothetical protein